MEFHGEKQLHSELKDKPEVLSKWKMYREARLDKEEKIREIQKVEISSWNNWLVNSIVGDAYCYFIGNGLAGRMVGRLAMNAYRHHHVVLYQKRVKNKVETFEYWAKRIRK